MARDMLLLVVDEVARNGAFGKILRPEVFPGAPLHSPYLAEMHSAGFPSSPGSSWLKRKED